MNDDAYYENDRSPASARFLRHGTGIVLAAVAGLVGITACGSGDGSGSGDGKKAAATAPGAQDQGSTGNSNAPEVLWMGDSIASAESPALGAALRASGAKFTSIAATGGGGVLGETAKPTWDRLPKKLASSKPDVVAYQITTYDWGKPAEQRAGYERLAKTVGAAGAELVFVTAPPFKLDDFYKPHEAEIKTAPEAAKDVADKREGTVRFLDAAALWGTDSSASKAQRSKDGIHSCQQGSAEFAQWLTKKLGRQYGFTPAAAGKWATGSWTGAEVYAQLGCS